MLKKSEPIFAVHDVKATIDFYQKVLGFGQPWFWGDPVTFGGINWGDVNVMFCQQPLIAEHVEGHMHWFWVEDVNGLHAQHVAAGAKVVAELGNRPWGVREYAVRDPNGYHLRFAGPLTFEKPATALSQMPDFIRIDQRLPTVEEYNDLCKSVNWPHEPAHFECASRSLLSVLAVDTRVNRAVGMARAVEDYPGWFGIWDVAVRPEYQSQRIGAALMECLQAKLRQRGAGGARVFLFSLKPDFYKRIGFAEETCMMRKI
jgi:uncharacterized glyoxalase superfamily protein PhnB